MINKTEKRAEVVHHLYMIQAIIKRMGNNSFLVKRWSIAVLAGILLLIRYEQVSEFFLLNILLCVPLTCFWYLDSYYLWQEREFRGVYNKVRVKTETDFAMGFVPEKNGIWKTAFSRTICPLYLIELCLIIFVIAIDSCYSGL